MNTNRLTTISMIATLSFVGRMMFSFLPNVQPTTAIVILVTLYLGSLDGLLVAIISIVMSNLYLGMGVWTLAQIVSFSVVVGVIHVFKRLNTVEGAYPYISAVLGMVYGFIISLVQAPFFGWGIFIPYYVSGIPFDISHAVGNFIFFIILRPFLSKILVEQRLKYSL